MFQNQHGRMIVCSHRGVSVLRGRRAWETIPPIRTWRGPTGQATRYYYVIFLAFLLSFSWKTGSQSLMLY